MPQIAPEPDFEHDFKWKLNSMMISFQTYIFGVVYIPDMS